MQSNKSNSNSIGSTTNENESIVESNKKSKQNIESKHYVTSKLATKSKLKKQIHPEQGNADLTESELQIDSEDEFDILDVHSKSNLNDECQNWWKESVTEYALVFFLFMKNVNIERGEGIIHISQSTKS